MTAHHMLQTLPHVDDNYASLTTTIVVCQISLTSAGHAVDIKYAE